MTNKAVWIIIAGLAAGNAPQTVMAAPEPTTSPGTEIVVQGEVLQEEAPVGPYDQPEWTTQRRFPTTRVYLQKLPYEAGVEQWWRLRQYKGDVTKQQYQEELEFGLPHRIQVDLYETWVTEDNGNTHHDSVSAEMRWALADWGRIPLNPTLYGEYKLVNVAADVFETKLLLGDELKAGWHYGINLIWEQEMGDARSTELAAAVALGKTIVDGKLSLGCEGRYLHVTEKGSRNDPEQECRLGPSLQWRPTRKTHLDVVPLWSVTDDGPQFESFVLFGIDFGGSQAKTIAAPVSTRHD